MNLFYQPNICKGLFCHAIFDFRNWLKDDSLSPLPYSNTCLCCLSGEISSHYRVRRWLVAGFGEGSGTPLQYSSLENPMDGGAWWAAVHGVARSRTRLSDFTFTHWRRQWQPTPVFLPGESQGLRSLVGCHLWGRRELDMTEAT